MTEETPKKTGFTKRKAIICCIITVVLFSVVILVILFATEKRQDCLLVFKWYGIVRSNKGLHLILPNAEYKYEKFSYYKAPNAIMASGKEKVKHGYYKGYWINNPDKLREESFYVHGKKIGESRYYYENGRLMRVDQCSADDFNYIPQTSTCFDIAGNKVAEVIDGTGELRKYHDNGRHIDRSIQVKNGRKHGNLISYFENGSICEKRVYRMSRLLSSVCYYKNGQKASEERYVDDKETIWQEKTWYENGEPESIGHRKNYKKHGLWEYYDKRGELTSSQKYEHGRPVTIKEN